MSDDGLMILGLKAENVKRLKVVEIRPDADGGLVVIAGPNAAGKTSVLDSIAYALGGKRLQGPKPIRDGQKTASVKVDLGELRVERTWTQSGSYLKVAGKDGAAIKSPQVILDRLVGDLSFDPLAFASADERDQAAMLARATGLAEKLAEIETRRAAAYGKRTEANRDSKRLEAHHASLAEAPEGTPEAEVSVTDLLAQRKKMEEQRQANQDIRARVDRIDEDIADQKGIIEHLSKDLQEAKRKMEALRTEGEKDREALSGLEDPDITAVDAKIESAESTNAAVRLRKSRASARIEWIAAKEHAESLSKTLRTCDEERDGLIAGAELPVSDLGLSESGVMFNGIPFAQASSAEQLKVSVGIAMALNPKLRVLRITDGSLLDAASMETIREMVKEGGFQVWIERVADSPDGAAIFIEDGSVVEGEST